MAGPADLFRQTVRYAALAGRDAFGKPSLGAVSSAPARVQPSRKTIRDANGAEHRSSHVVYTAAPITLAHRCFFPGDDTANPNAMRRPVAIDEEVDGAGVTRFRKVWF